MKDLKKGKNRLLQAVELKSRNKKAAAFWLY